MVDILQMYKRLPFTIYHSSTIYEIFWFIIKNVLFLYILSNLTYFILTWLLIFKSICYKTFGWPFTLCLPLLSSILVFLFQSSWQVLVHCCLSRSPNKVKVNSHLLRTSWAPQTHAKHLTINTDTLCSPQSSIRVCVPSWALGSSVAALSYALPASPSDEWLISSIVFHSRWIFLQSLSARLKQYFFNLTS